MRKPGIKAVQSAVTNCGFPDTMDCFITVLEDAYVSWGQHLTDVEALYSWQPEFKMGWSAPKWITAGDILFFYLTRKAIPKAKKVRRDFQKHYEEKAEAENAASIMDILDENINLMRDIEGAIFACARVDGDAFFSENEPEHHFRGRVFAPITEVYCFRTVIDYDCFSDRILLNSPTINPLGPSEFEMLRDLIVESNPEVPDYLKNARPAMQGLRDVTQENWLDVTCAPDLRFLSEAQVRGYFIDHLLAELADPGTKVHVECACVRNGCKTGLVDYMISVNGVWTPVEAKLNVGAERDIAAQVAKYLCIESFQPAGKKRSNSDCRAKVALVVDQHGLYLVNSNGFISGNYGSPAWKRSELTQTLMSELKSRIATENGSMKRA